MTALMLVEEAVRKLGLIAGLASVSADHRDQTKVRPSIEEIFGQRTFQIGCKYPMMRLTCGSDGGG